MKKLIGIFILSVVSFATYSQDDEEATSRNFVLKFAPTQIVAGELNFSYEQRIARIISLELEVGPTISQFGLNFGNQKLWRGSDGLGIWNFDPISYDASSAIGFHVSLAPRFYPASDDNLLKGLYLSPVFKFRQYNYNIEDNQGLLDDETSRINQGIFRFNFGLQFWPKGGKFSIDMFFGIGLSTFNLKDHQAIGEYDPVTMDYTTKWVETTDKGVRFNAATGIKFGFGM
ncbi:hypothetical protein [Fluviicola taffensis]|uniref:DUF3575 domain-containing protein n=1 Tax=Fluviicola taffensis (strain DSM 16823 / NCIMB 13979 / RW262) TaxID=755732 RepID=F2IBX9_FLUTR|nr:hypothetical protein [Fluviicola taffensis]AEA42207.1 hypothetical protein Fluta_0198 [Fluviicola taffensis DSM 16823]